MRIAGELLCGLIGVSLCAAASPAGAVTPPAVDRHGAAPPQAVPLGNPGDWIESDDYPPAAILAHEEGVSLVKLDIGPDGRVVTCTITTSSGSPTLDEATCTLITLRARFVPAMDPQGHALPSIYVNRVRWTLPKKVTASQPSLLRFSFLVTADGDVTDCRVDKAEGAVTAEHAALIAQSPCKANVTVPPYTDAGGHPVARRVIQTRQIEVEPVTGTPAASAAPAPATP